MAVIDLTQRSGGASTTEYKVLPTDVYYMTIVSAADEENQFADADRNGNKPRQLVITWEVSKLTEEQEEADDADDLLGARVWQRINLYYGGVREGGVSKLQSFIDNLREQGCLPNFNLATFDTDTLEGIQQRVSVEKYIKSQGPNAGKPGNKVVAVLPLKRVKKAVKPVESKPSAPETDDDLPF